MPAMRAPVGSLDELNDNTHITEVNYLTQILVWVRNSQLRFFQGKKCHREIPSEGTAGTELISGISSEPEQFLTLKLP